MEERFLQQDALLTSVFTPGTPVSIVDLFQGRTTQIREALDAINRLGQHAVIYGERGVGKTSLASIIPLLMQTARNEIFTTRVNCATGDSFITIWRKVFYNLRTSSRAIGFGQSNNQIIGPSVSESLPEDFGPSEVMNLLSKLPHSVIVIDEFDRVMATGVSSLFADLIKQLADFQVDTTILLIGVADNISELLGEHASIVRCCDQIKLPFMTNVDLGSVIKVRLPLAKMTFEHDVPFAIARLSQGIPYYAHLFGLYSGRAALDAGKTNVEISDVRTAIRTIVLKVQASIQEEYQNAIQSSHMFNLYEDVLLACALAAPDDFGYFVTTSVRDALSKITTKSYDISSFSGHIKDFCHEGRGRVLERKGKDRRWKYRFSNPLLRPYVYIRGIDRGAISDRWEPL